MTRICITGSTDGIGLAATRLLLADGHDVVVHARSEQRGRPVVDELARSGNVSLVVGDLADLAQVRRLAGDIGAVDVLVHNAGVWARPGAALSAQGHEITFAVNALAPHVLTGLLAEQVRERVVFLGSGMVGSGRVDPSNLGASSDPMQAYCDSKAVDVALASGWARRLPHLRLGAVDPGWVKTKLASTGAPGDVRSGGRRVAFAAVDPAWTGGYTTGPRAAKVPAALDSETLQDDLLDALDRLAARD